MEDEFVYEAREEMSGFTKSFFYDSWERRAQHPLRNSRGRLWQRVYWAVRSFVFDGWGRPIRVWTSNSDEAFFPLPGKRLCPIVCSRKEMPDRLGARQKFFVGGGGGVYTERC